MDWKTEKPKRFIKGAICTDGKGSYWVADYVYGLDTWSDLSDAKKNKKVLAYYECENFDYYKKPEVKKPVKAKESADPIEHAARCRLIPARRYTEYRNDLSQGTINGLMLKRKENGFDSCVRCINNRLYIVEDKFEDYILSQEDRPRRF